MAKKEPKTLKGMERKLGTGDGRKSTVLEKFIKKPIDSSSKKKKK